MPRLAGERQCGVVMIIHQAGIGGGFQQAAHTPGTTSRRSSQQGSCAPGIFGIHCSPGFQQEPHASE